MCIASQQSWRVYISPKGCISMNINTMNYFLYLILGITPSLIWLSFYLRKDAHPEPKRTVLKIFFLGMGAAALAALTETVVKNLILMLFSETDRLGIMIQVFYICWGVALIEEILKYCGIEKKYMVLKNGVVREVECDEPLDIMLYMVISALGFAALENILIFLLKSFPPLETLLVASLRFIGATFLHALCSGTLGFFLALSYLKHKKRFQFFTMGLILAVLLHGIFNYSIIRIEQSLTIIDGSVVILDQSLFLFSIATIVIALLSMGIFVSWGFKKLRKIKSVCMVR